MNTTAQARADLDQVLPGPHPSVEIIMFTILSDYAYGDVGSPPRIPGGATLTFEVELFEFEGEDISPDKDKSITRRIKTAGEGFDHPNVSIFSRYLSFI